jgi:hypothetical protein
MDANTDQVNFPNQHQPEPQTVDAALAHSFSEAKTIAPNGANGNGHAHAAQDLARDRATAPFNGESVLILYGTVTGNSEALAKKLADALAQLVSPYVSATWRTVNRACSSKRIACWSWRALTATVNRPTTRLRFGKRSYMATAWI